MVCFKIKGIQIQYDIILSPNKQLVINKGIIGTVIFIKFKVIVKQLFELLQFVVNILLCRLCFIWIFAFYFIDSIIIYQLCNKLWLDVLKKYISSCVFLKPVLSTYSFSLVIFCKIISITSS